MKVEFKQKEFREGSMGAKEQKSFNTWRIVVGAVYLFILALLFVIPNYQHDLQAKQGALLGIMGAVLIIASYGVFFCIPYYTKLGIGWVVVLMVGLLLFGWLVAIGFQGSLDEIAPR